MMKSASSREKFAARLSPPDSGTIINKKASVGRDGYIRDWYYVNSQG